MAPATPNQRHRLLVRVAVGATGGVGRFIQVRALYPCLAKSFGPPNSGWTIWRDYGSRLKVLGRRIRDSGTIPRPHNTWPDAGPPTVEAQRSGPIIAELGGATPRPDCDECCRIDARLSSQSTSPRLC